MNMISKDLQAHNTFEASTTALNQLSCRSYMYNAHNHIHTGRYLIYNVYLVIKICEKNAINILELIGLGLHH